MSFVKTNDGRVYDIGDPNHSRQQGKVYYSKSYRVNDCTYTTNIPKVDVVDMKDNLKELCDEFVAVDTKKQLPNSLIDFDDIKEDIELNGDRFEYYGANWAPDMLVFVAKVNNDTLELKVKNY